MKLAAAVIAGIASAPFHVMLGALVISIPASVAWRVIVWAMDGYWLTSTCISLHDLSQRGLRVSWEFACYPAKTGWVGLDNPWRWIMTSADVSVVLFGTAVLVGILLLVGMGLYHWAQARLRSAVGPQENTKKMSGL